MHNPKVAGSSITAALGVEKDPTIGQHAPLHAIPGADRLFSFGFVRNPWDRAVSLYVFLCQKPLRPSDRYDQAEVRALGFKKWLLEWDYGEECQGPQYQWRNPQVWWLDGCDYVGRFERIQADFDEVCGLVGLSPRKLPHRNKMGRRHYREFYDCETAAAVTKWFLPDIEVWNYEF